MLDAILELCRARKWLAARGHQRTDSTHVLGMIRALHRLECAGETMRHALDSLAVSAPDWLRRLSPPEWLDRYGRRFDDYRLPKGKDERQAYAEQIGADGHALLDAIYAYETEPWLRQIPAVEIMREVRVQQFYRSEADIHWRTEAEGVPPLAWFIASPYDPEVHFAKKRSTSWVGYKVHLTESCEEDQPHLITHVETTAAPVADGDVLETITYVLAADDLPAVHLTDTGYVDAKRLLSSRTRYDVDLLERARRLSPPRAREQRLCRAGLHHRLEAAAGDLPGRADQCQLVPDAGTQGQTGNPGQLRQFACKSCPHRLDCIDADGVRRTLTLQMPELQIALQAARHREKTAEFREQYGKRAGIEGTISQGVRAFDLRHSRYIGSAKTHLQHLLIAAAIDLSRIYCWLVGEPRAQTRQSAFTALMIPKGCVDISCWCRYDTPFDWGGIQAMGPSEFSEALQALSQMSVQQLQLVASEASRLARDAEARSEIERHIGNQPGCPHCGQAHVIRWGTHNGLQRWRCRGCDKTFNSAYGSGLAQPNAERLSTPSPGICWRPRLCRAERQHANSVSTE